jgi:hypothetical protein
VVRSFRSRLRFRLLRLFRHVLVPQAVGSGTKDIAADDYLSSSFSFSTLFWLRGFRASFLHAARLHAQLGVQALVSASCRFGTRI